MEMLPKKINANFKDLTGQIFSRLTVIRFEKLDNHYSSWVCLCVCGNTCIVAGRHLKSGGTKSCGCLIKIPFFEDLTGKKFNRLSVIRYDKSINNVHYFLVRCDCGEEKVIAGRDFKYGNTKSCGCFAREQRKKSPTKFKPDHGMSKTREYNLWRAMHERCSNKKNKNYRYYGERGIKVCERWADFVNFLADMGSKPEGLSLDRIDNDGDYEPRNCRWADAITQAGNKRPRKPRKLNEAKA